MFVASVDEGGCADGCVVRHTLVNPLPQTVARFASTFTSRMRPISLGYIRRNRKTIISIIGVPEADGSLKTELRVTVTKRKLG